MLRYHHPPPISYAVLRTPALTNTMNLPLKEYSKADLGRAMIGPLLGPDLHELISEKNWYAVRDALSGFDPSDIAEVLITVSDEDDVAIFRLLPRELAGRVFAYLPLDHQEN